MSDPCNDAGEERKLPFQNSMKTGIEQIAEERERQISKEGYDPDHDDCYVNGELCDAATCYAVVGGAVVRGSSANEWPASMVNGMDDDTLSWPWDDRWWKPSDDPIRNLVKAGALIAAEIDRLNRRGK